MGGIHGKSKSEESSQVDSRQSNASNVIDGGIGSTISMTQITGSDHVTMTDHEAVNRAFDLGELILDNSTSFINDSLDFVQSNSDRNYDFAENVAIPLNAQMTEDFTRYAIIGAVVISLGYFATKIKWTK